MDSRTDRRDHIVSRSHVHYHCEWEFEQCSAVALHHLHFNRKKWKNECMYDRWIVLCCLLPMHRPARPNYNPSNSTSSFRSNYRKRCFEKSCFPASLSITSSKMRTAKDDDGFSSSHVVDGCYGGTRQIIQYLHNYFFLSLSLFWKWVCFHTDTSAAPSSMERASKTKTKTETEPNQTNIFIFIAFIVMRVLVCLGLYRLYCTIFDLLRCAVEQTHVHQWTEIDGQSEVGTI